MRWVVVAAVAAALGVSSPAHAHGRAVVTPAGSALTAEWFETLVELPTPVNPLWGMGTDPCVHWGGHDRMLSIITFGEHVTCTVELGTVPITGFGHFCSTFDPPGSDFYAVERREQRRCAREVTPEDAIRVSVDGGRWVYLIPEFTPQTSVFLPVDNVWGRPAGAPHLHRLRVVRDHPQPARRPARLDDRDPAGRRMALVRAQRRGRAAASPLTFVSCA